MLQARRISRVAAAILLGVTLGIAVHVSFAQRQGR
jgi:hypothetical protein